MIRILPGLAVALLFPIYYLCLQLAIEFELPSSNATHSTRALAVVLMSILFFYSYRNGQLQAKWTFLHLSILVFMTLYAFRIFSLNDEATWNLDSELYPFEKVSLLFIFGSIVPFIIVMFSAKLFMERSTSNVFMGLTFLSVAVVAFYNIDQFGVYRTRGVVSGTLASLPMGYLAALGIAYCVLDFLKLRRFPVILLVAVLCCAVYLLSVSASRGPILALVVTSSYVLLTMKKSVFNMLTSSVFFLVLFAGSVWFFNFSGSGILTRIDSTDKGESRLEIFSEALGIWESSPIFGKDIAVSYGFWPHNLPLESLMAVGIFGFLLIVPWICALFKVVIDSKAEDRQWLHIWFLQTTVMNMVTGSIWAASSLFVCLSLVLGGGKVLSKTSSSRRNRRKKRRRKTRRVRGFAEEGF